MQDPAVLPTSIRRVTARFRSTALSAHTYTTQRPSNTLSSSRIRFVSQGCACFTLLGQAVYMASSSGKDGLGVTTMVPSSAAPRVPPCAWPAAAAGAPAGPHGPA